MGDFKKFKLSGSREKIIVLTAIIVSAFIVFFKFIYLPHSNELEKLKKDASALESEISGIKAEANGGQSLEGTIIKLQNRFVELENKFPQKEEVILRELPAFAQKAGIEIRSMNPGKKQKLKDLAGKPVVMEGCSVEEMNVSIDIRAPYRTVGEYIRMLKEDFPAFVRVVSVGMAKEDASNLKVNLSLAFYLVSKK